MTAAIISSNARNLSSNWPYVTSPVAHNEDRSIGPAPITDLGHIAPMSGDVTTMFMQLVLQLFNKFYACGAGLWKATNGIDDQVKTVQFVEHCHIEWRSN